MLSNTHYTAFLINMIAYWSLSRAPLTKTLLNRALKIAQIESSRDSIFIFVLDTGGEQKGLPIKETLTGIFFKHVHQYKYSLKVHLSPNFFFRSNKFPYYVE